MQRPPLASSYSSSLHQFYVDFSIAIRGSKKWRGGCVEETAVRRHGTPKPAAIPSGEDSVWADMSSLLRAACNEIQEGELIHGENFNLFAAMSALEIMDPKTDSGIVCNYYSLDEANDDGAAPVPISFDKTIDAQCTIDIMDHLLSCEEEDIFTLAYGLPLNVKDEKCLAVVNAVEETIARQLRACKASPSGRKVIDDFEPLQNDVALEEGYCRAILCRLCFRKHFYHVIMSMKRPQGRGLPLARKHISSCLSELQSILKSEEFLRSNASGCQSVEDGGTTASGCRPVGFDASLNARLSAPTPPRSIKILSWREAIEYFTKLLQDLDVICSLPLDVSLEGTLHFVVQFQKTRPDLVARAHLQNILVQDGKLFGRDAMFALISKAAGVPEAVKNHNIQQMEFIVQLGLLVVNLLRILCTNAAWQRRKLGKILQDWRVIHMQIELALRQENGDVSHLADDLSFQDNILRQILLWVEEQTYWIASRFIILGFELELYSPGEYCMVYWYIYIIWIKLAEKMHHRMSSNNSSAKSKGKKKKGSALDASREFQIPATVLFIQSQMCLAEGLTLMIAALKNERMLSNNPSPFNTDHERFLQHFEVLQKAGVPEDISYWSFEEATKTVRFSTLVMYNYFKDAQRIARDIKHHFLGDPDRLSELRKIEQVAEHNSVALNVVCRLGSFNSSLKVSFEFSHHPFFASAVVKRSS